MIHNKALQRESGGRWDYTSGRRATGYCAGWTPWTAERLAKLWPMADCEARAAEMNAEEAPFVERYHTDGHATVDEACECYRQYCLDRRLRFSPDSPKAKTVHKCEAEGCEVFTSGVAEVHYLMGMWHLCEAHRTRDVVATLFGPVGESWHS